MHLADNSTDRTAKLEADGKPVDPRAATRIQPRALSIDQAAEYLNLHRTTIYLLEKRGKLKIRRVGGRSLVLRDDLDKLLEAS